MAKIIQRFGKRVQNPVFECVLEAAQLELMTWPPAASSLGPKGREWDPPVGGGCLDGSFGKEEVGPGFAGDRVEL